MEARSTQRYAPLSTRFARRSAKPAKPEEPSDDERHHPELERRREIAKARRQREHDRPAGRMDKALPEVFAATREAMRRTLGMRHFDVQLMAASSCTRARSPR